MWSIIEEVSGANSTSIILFQPATYLYKKVFVDGPFDPEAQDPRPKRPRLDPTTHNPYCLYAHLHFFFVHSRRHNNLRRPPTTNDQRPTTNIAHHQHHPSITHLMVCLAEPDLFSLPLLSTPSFFFHHGHLSRSPLSHARSLSLSPPQCPSTHSAAPEQTRRRNEQDQHEALPTALETQEEDLTLSHLRGTFESGSGPDLR